MAEFDRSDLKKLEKLAKITCTEEEEDKLFHNIKKIILYVEQLSEVNTENTPCCNFVTQLQISNVFREDEVTPSFAKEKFLENVPDHIGDMIRTPPVIDQ